MSEKYNNKYRIDSHRLPGWDYSDNGYYFLTIVTQNRECNLGEIIDTDDNVFIKLSDYGKIVENEWYKSFEMRNELFLDEFIIMPNHIHAIVVLEKPKNDDSHNVAYNTHTTHATPRTHDTHATHVETHGRASLQQQPQQQRKSKSPEFIRKPKSISSFIGGFKSVINSKIDDYIDENNLNIPKYNRNNHFFQPNYYDHIIRNNTEYERIKNYIINNPLNWKKDKFYE